MIMANSRSAALKGNIRTMSIASCRSGCRKNQCSHPSMSIAEARHDNTAAFRERAAPDADDISVEEAAARPLSFAFIDIIDVSSL